MNNKIDNDKNDNKWSNGNSGIISKILIIKSAIRLMCKYKCKSKNKNKNGNKNENKNEN